MRVVVVTPPVATPVSLAEAKAQLRKVEFADDDVDIRRMVRAATAWLDGPAGWLGRALVSQTLELQLEGFSPWCWDRRAWEERPRTCRFDRIPLPCRPVASIVSVTYVDTLGVDQVLDPSIYRLFEDGLLLRYQQAWPTHRQDPGAVRIRYVAGYGATPADVPEDIRQAILMLVSHFDANREAVVGIASRDSPAEPPFAVSALLSPYQVWDR